MNEEAGSLPRPAQGEATWAAGSVPAAHARSGAETTAMATARKPRRSPLAQLRRAYLLRGPTVGTHRMSTTGRNAVRGASVVSRRGSLGPPGGEVDAAGLDGEDAGISRAAHRRRRLGARAIQVVKEPSAARACAALLNSLRSRSPSHSALSNSSGRTDRTVEVVMADSYCPRLGTHTPNTSDEVGPGVPRGVHGGAGAAGQRDAPCRFVKGALAP